jgi:HSP20 family protein
MHNVSIEKIHQPEREASSLSEAMENLAESVRLRAFDHFLARGGAMGNDLDDWLLAERELVWIPNAKITENDKQIKLRLHAPELEPDHIKVTAMPDSILVQAEVSRKQAVSNGKERFCESAAKMVRRFQLPEAINLDKVSATLNKGILQITAAKEKVRSKGIAARAAAGAHA